MLTDHNQQHRRNAILRLLRASTVRRQSELAQLLRQDGFAVTQSSVSRDLRELGVAQGERALRATARRAGAGTGKFRGDRAVRARDPPGRPLDHRRADDRGRGAERRASHRRGGLARSGRARSPATIRSSSPLRRSAPSAASSNAFTPSFASDIFMNQPKPGAAAPIVLAYSGGLDTSFLVPWLAENYAAADHHRHGGHGRHRRRGRQRRCASARSRSAQSSTTRSTRARTTSSRCCGS